MNPKVGIDFIEGWALSTSGGMYLYKGNPNPEYEDMRLDSFGTAAFCSRRVPTVFSTKWEAQEQAKKWNALLHRKCKGLPCISREAMVRPVKVKISIEEV
jgi:hypothetical protein